MGTRASEDDARGPASQWLAGLDPAELAVPCHGVASRAPGIIAHDRARYGCPVCTEVKVQVEGTLSAVSDTPWIVLAAADEQHRWGGIESQGKLDLRGCLFASAAVAASSQRGNVSANGCIFVDAGTGFDVGNNGHGTADNCLFLRNELGLIAHGDAGRAISRCLFLLNKRGCTANFYGRCEGSKSTFYSNDVAIEAADRGNSVRVNLSNIITSGTGGPLGFRGGKAVAVGNYWGTAGPPTGQDSDVSGPLATAVKDAMPSLPPCEYLSFAALPVHVAPEPTPATVQGATGSVTPAPPDTPDSGAKAFLGTWEKSTLRGWKKFSIEPEGRAMAQDGQVRSWSVKDQKLHIAWPNENQVYEVPVGDTMTGESDTSHGKRNPLKSRRISGDSH